LFASAPSRTSDLALVGAKIYPSPTDPPIENGSILIHNGQILDVGPSATVKIPRDAKIIDCKGLVVTAGFWNSHVHIFTPGLLHVRDSRSSELDELLDMMFNRWGFTTVFDISSVLDNTIELRGPHILTVGEPTETPEQAIALVRDHAAKGANGINLFTGSYQGEGKVAVLPLAIAKAAVEEAHRHHLPVFAHPQNSEGAEVAMDSGVDVLAHTVPQSPPWTPDFVARLKNANMSLIPTLTLFDFEARKGKSSDEERENWIAKMVAELRAYSQAGGDILFGTDIGYTDHYDTLLEFSLMSQAGMSFQQILASSDRRGRIAKGMEADVVILSADPSMDATAFSNVRYTIRSGKVIYPEK
jgi:imidazolonepropionase-like amidohydrolase